MSPFKDYQYIHIFSQGLDEKECSVNFNRLPLSSYSANHLCITEEMLWITLVLLLLNVEFS